MLRNPQDARGDQLVDTLPYFGILQVPKESSSGKQNMRLTVQKKSKPEYQQGYSQVYSLCRINASNPSNIPTQLTPSTSQGFPARSEARCSSEDHEVFAVFLGQPVRKKRGEKGIKKTNSKPELLNISSQNQCNLSTYHRLNAPAFQWKYYRPS